MIKKIDTTCVEEWQECLNAMESYDFYHTSYYSDLSKKNGEGEPYLFIFEYERYKIIIPLLKRNIPNTKYYDYTSVYGYPGPLSNYKIIPQNVIKQFRKEIKEFLDKEDVVSVFSRLNPIINNNVLDNIGEVEEHSLTVSIDLEENIDIQRKHYRKSLKSDLNQLRKKHKVTTRFTENANDILKFISLYYENMKRVNAKDYYYFSEDYFFSFFKQNQFKTKLLIAEKDNEIIAGAMFTFINDIIQYHLAATNEDFIKITPMKLIIDEIRIFGSLNNFKNLHLGGGLGGENDSLFRFKSGFTKRFLNFKLWKYIVNQNIYDKLVKEKVNNFNQDYFPLYRLH